LKKSKTILLFKVISITVFIIGVLNTIINHNVYPKSKYNNEKEITGLITNCQKTEYNTNITIKAKEKIIITYTKEFKCKLGIKIKANGKLEKPNENTIFNAFNYRKYALSQKINYIFKANKITIINNHQKGLYKIKDNLQNKLNTYKSKKYLNTFILGNNKQIEEDIINSYQTNGISHLLAISGMHITLISIILLFLLNKINKLMRIRPVIRYFFFILMYFKVDIRIIR